MFENSELQLEKTKKELALDKTKNELALLKQRKHRVHTTMPLTMPSSVQSPRGFSLQEHMLRMIMFLAAFLQVTLQKANEWPPVTEFAIRASIVAMLIYILAIYVEEKVASTNEEAAKIIGYYGTLCGSLTIVLLLLMLDQTIGWIIFGFWVCSFLAVIYWSYQQIFDALCKSIGKVHEYIGAFFDRWFNVVMEGAIGNV